MSSRNLIDAIDAGDSVEIENAFNSIMATKVSETIDNMRSDIAQTMFASEETIIDDEEYDDEELTLEDYSLEELEEYMMSEEFEQLDELSKSTIGNYIKKSKGHIIMHGTTLGTNTTQKIKDKSADMMQKRAKGINKAVDRLTQ
jgi:hypothetical protein